MDYFRNTRYFFFGSMGILVGVVYYFLGSISLVQKSPGGDNGDVNLFWVFIVLGFVLIGLGWYLKALEGHGHNRRFKKF